MNMTPPHNPMQAYIDAMGREWQKQRAETQMTIGKLIARLESLPQDECVAGLGDLDSYRGYYDDLAFEPDKTERTVADLLKECQGAMGKVFQGYKGGDFMMGESTPLWVAEYGCCGKKLVGLVKIGGHYEPSTVEDGD